MSSELWNLLPKTWFRGLYPLASAERNYVLILFQAVWTLFHILYFLHSLLSSVAKHLVSIEITPLQVLRGYPAKDYGATGTASICTVSPLYSPFCYCTVEQGSLS